MIPWTSTIETLLATADNQDTPDYVTPIITKAMAPLTSSQSISTPDATLTHKDEDHSNQIFTTKELDTLIQQGQGRNTAMETYMEDQTVNTTIKAEDSPIATEARLTNTLQQVQEYLQEAFTLTKKVVEPLVTTGVHKYVMVVLFLLAANWLGTTIYNAIPFSLGGIPVTIGTAYLCPLVLRKNREKVAEALREYLG